MVIPGGTSLTLAPCTNKHNANLAYLVSLGKLQEVKRAESLVGLTISFGGLAASLTDERKRACVSDCSFVSMCCTNGID